MYEQLWTASGSLKTGLYWLQKHYQQFECWTSNEWASVVEPGAIAILRC